MVDLGQPHRAPEARRQQEVPHCGRGQEEGHHGGVRGGGGQAEMGCPEL